MYFLSFLILFPLFLPSTSYAPSEYVCEQWVEALQDVGGFEEEDMEEWVVIPHHSPAGVAGQGAASTGTASPLDAAPPSSADSVKPYVDLAEPIKPPRRGKQAKQQERIYDVANFAEDDEEAQEVRAREKGNVGERQIRRRCPCLSFRTFMPRCRALFATTALPRKPRRSRAEDGFAFACVLLLAGRRHSLARSGKVAKRRTSSIFRNCVVVTKDLIAAATFYI